jgi:nucleoside-diphosphate-sugar epimerase
MGVQVELLDLSNRPTRWQDAMRSVECVIHLAARVHRFGRADATDIDAEKRINTDGSRFVAEQAAAAGVRRLVMLSSIKVNGEGTPQGIRYRSTDIPSPADAYGNSKMAAETAIRDVCGQSDTEYVIARPPLIYGPGVKANFRRLMRAIDLGIPLPFGSIGNRRSMVGIENLCSFIETCTVHPRASGKTWLVSDGDDLSTPELVEKLAKLMARRTPLFRFPPTWLKFLARSLGRAEELERLMGSLQVDSEPATEELGWRPGISVNQGLARTVAAYKMEQRCMD